MKRKKLVFIKEFEVLLNATDVSNCFGMIEIIVDIQ